MITVTRPLSPDPVVFSGFVDRIFETACFSNAGPLVQELEAKLKAHDWNVAETARAIDMPRSNLYKKLERHGLAREPG